MPARNGPGGLARWTACPRRPRFRWRLHAGEGAQELHLTVAFRTGNADDLATATVEVDGAEPSTAELRDIMSNRRRLLVDLRLGEQRVHRPAHHQCDDVGLGECTCVERALSDAVAQHRDTVATSSTSGNLWLT